MNLAITAVLIFIVSIQTKAFDLDQGKKIYTSTCMACHDTGLAGAPKFGNAAEWNPRIAAGFDKLVKSSINGLNVMPPRGGNVKLTDEDLKNAVQYMISAVGSAGAAKGESADKKNDTKPVGADKDAKPHSFVTVLKINEKYNFPTDEKGYFKPANIENAPKDKFGDEIRMGYNIFTETQKYAPRYSGRGLTCQSCHLQAGLKPYAIPVWGAVGIYPVYRNASDRSDNMADRIQSCFRASVNGFAPPHDSPEIRALIAYFQFVSQGVPVGVSLPGRSMPDDGRFSLPVAGAEPSPSRGKLVFQSKCVTCHQVDGKGFKKADGMYQFPPLWGWDSYNKSASMYKNDYLARFIWGNMPLGQDFSLTPQEAWDVAAFINIHERPKDPSRGILSEIFGK